MKFKTPSLLLLFAIFFVACKSNKEFIQLSLSETQQVIFLDSIAAAKTIIEDKKENFFKDITKTDMSIQMKKVFAENVTREQALEEYRAFLKTEVLDFTAAEVVLVKKVMQKVYDKVNQLSPNIFPQQIRLIKTHANHYGPGTYYTREDCIVIPKFVLSTFDEGSFYSTMLHELFHIYSRYNPEMQKALYQLIGFKAISHPEFLKMSDALKNRILLNPDGVNYAFAINLKTQEDERIQAIPIIVSNESRYVETKNEFFAYLNFSLYKIEPPLSRLIPVKADKDGFSPLKLNELPDFFRQIKDNTNYIIHPDEIMADNFMILINSLDKDGALDQYSKEGQTLLMDIKKLLMK